MTTLAATPERDGDVMPGRGLSGLAVLMTLVAFGPYLSTSVGVRTEQPIFFIAALVGFIYSARISRTWLSGPALFTLFCLVSVVIVGALGVAFPVVTSNPAIVPGSVVAGVVNNLEPVAGVLVALALLTAGQSRETIFRSVAMTLVVLMCLNAAIAILSATFDLTPFLQHFWQATSEVGYSNSVAVRSAAQGRFGGIMNQPAQAGFLYGLALLCTFYVARGRRGDRPILFTCLAFLLIVGGIMTVSKVFLFVAIPLAGALLISSSTGRLRRITTVVLVGFIGFSLLSLVGALNAFPGADQLKPYFEGGSSPLSLFSGGRLGSGGNFAETMGLVLSAKPFSGIGLGGIEFPYDSAWVQAAVTAGYVGIVFYLSLTIQLVYRCIVLRHRDPTHRLMVSIVALTIIANIGFPVFTGNRISGILWMVLTVLLLSDRPWSPAIELDSERANVPVSSRRSS